MADQSDESRGGPIILIDNNLIQSFLSKEIGPQLEPILKEVVDIKAELAVSDIILYEALKAIVFDEKKWKPVADFIDNTLARYEVNRDVLINAAKVHELYGGNENTRNHRQGISTEDIIIATTSMMLGAYIMTSDCNDFPRPFFTEVNKQIVFYKQGVRTKHIVIYLLQPDMEVIEHGLNHLVKVKTPTK